MVEPKAWLSLFLNICWWNLTTKLLLHF